MDSSQHTAKVFVDGASDLAAKDFILAFHRIIQQKALDETLIDVTDYSHVHHGPGVMLLAHEAHYAMDSAAGRLGLLYARKRGGAGSARDRIREALRRALAASGRLEEDADLRGRLRFRGDEILLGIDDRLHAPNTAETLALYRPELEVVLASLWAGAPFTVERVGGPKECFKVLVSSPGAPGVAELLTRLDAA